MTQSENVAELFAALSVAQGKMGSALKESVNPHFKSKYADLASVIDVLKKPLAENGLAVLQFPRAGFLTTLVTHKSGQWLREDDTPVLPRDGTPMAYGAALTYARRQSFQTVLGIAADEDDDTGGSAPPSGPQGEQRPNPFNRGPVPAISQPRAPGAAPAIVPKPAQAQGKPTTDQLTRLFTICHSRKPAGWSEDAMRQVMRERFGVGSSKELSLEQYSELCTVVLTEAPPKAQAVAADGADGEFDRFMEGDPFSGPGEAGSGG